MPAPVPATPNVIQADPVPATPSDVQAGVPRVMDGSSEELALGVMDSKDELVSDMVLTPRQAVTVQINKHSFKHFSY